MESNQKMSEDVSHHECFKQLFEKFKGAERSIEIPTMFDRQNGELYTQYWSILIYEKPKGNSMFRLFMSYCPMCGADLRPQSVIEQEKKNNEASTD